MPHINNLNIEIMKKGMKKFTAGSDNFYSLQALRNIIKDEFSVANVKWCGEWSGLEWSSFSFYCTQKELENIESFCEFNELDVDFS